MRQKSGYKYQIEQELIKKNWEIVTIDSSRIWWDAEHWKIQFKYDADVSCYVCFIVDPQFEGPIKDGQGIYEVKASSEFPKNWNDDQHRLASIS